MSRCWSCEAETGAALFCPSCGKILPPVPGATHFDVLGIQRGVTVSVPELDAKFRELSQKLHPDKFAQKEARERRFSLEQTTALNEAHRTLRDPVRRAFYLLKLHGVDLNREDAGTQKDLPLEILEEVIERREALDIARKARDLVKVRKLAEEAQQLQAQTLSEAEAELAKLESGKPDSEALTRATHALARIRYDTRFLEEVDAIEEENAL